MIFEILNIFVEIMSFYNTSTLPKFIKKIICRSRIYKLNKILKKAKDLKYYTWSDIYMILKYIESNKSESEVTSDYLRYIFNVVEEDGSVNNIDISFDNNQEAMDIRCKIQYGDNSISSMVLGIKDSNVEQATSEVITIALNDVNDIIRKYIDDISDDLKKKSERLYDNDKKRLSGQ